MTPELEFALIALSIAFVTFGICYLIVHQAEAQDKEEIEYIKGLLKKRKERLTTEQREKAAVIEKRTKMVHFRCTLSELETLKKKAGKKEVSEYIREKVFKKPGVGAMSIENE